jgi:hypothetical protein
VSIAAALPQSKLTYVKQDREAAAAKEQEELAMTVKREKKGDHNPRPRKVARPSSGDTQLELDDDGSFRERSTSALPRTEIEVIELD